MNKELETFNKILEYEINPLDYAVFLKENNLGNTIKLYDIIDSNLPNELILVFKALEKLSLANYEQKVLNYSVGKIAMKEENDEN